MQKVPVLLAVIAFTFFVLHGARTISLDTDAQAGIAYLFLPFYALLPAIAGWGLGKAVQQGSRYRTSKRHLVVWGTIGVVLILALLGMYNFAAGARTELVAFQLEEKQARAQFRANVSANRARLRDLQSENPGQESAVLDQEFKAATSTEMRLAIAQNEFAQPQLLDQLARTDEIVVINNVLRHRATSPKTLVWIFQEYVAQDREGYGKFLESKLSKHPNASPGLLRDIYNSGQFHSPKSLLENPNLPPDIRQVLQGENAGD